MKPAMKKVLVLGACGNIGPFVTPGLEDDYGLTLSDIVPHPHGTPTIDVDVTDYGQVRDAARGMDAIINLTVVRPDPVLSFQVNVRGALNAMKAAAEHGIPKVLHTGPEQIRHGRYDHDFDLNDPPHMPGVGYYFLTKHLSNEICRTYAREHDITTVCFLFNLLSARPTKHVTGRDFPPYMIVWEDLQHACRLALEIQAIPDNFQMFDLHSHLGQGKFSIDKARRILGYEPLAPIEEFYRRSTDA
ncbi:NAD(P)-dependent oxidoreductase [Candidatus Poribacteria bacterium]|jgi:nucleoside-diphosphate-sugar epimerase|nr:NAD(P)-dependent oxidoreductase [Candidatus Poribacteria bacterium]MBT5710721.1 NAD(P)-dependent oxidoreductase [Candidatus Poribacteria bacterium]MBT7095901.1 NAD(P)-dependent oxidoreductase [Candidatus Poribacteria bacterium]MBT7808196.1 NAD(P)-dependent oxidoreductase [Candidatus Poribacteria bacterium]